MPELKRVERLRIAEEAAGSSTFAVDLSGSIASFDDLFYRALEITLGRDMLPTDQVTQRPYTNPYTVIGRKTAEASIETDLLPRGTALTAGTTPAYTDTAMGTLLKVIMGGYYADEGDTEDGAFASTTSVVGVATDGSRWTPGGAIGVNNANGFEMREVSSIAGNQITPKVQFSAAPTNGSAVTNAETFFLTDDPATSLQMVVETADRDDIWWLQGMQASSISFDLTLNALATMTVGLRGADWEHDDDVGTPLGGGALALGTIADGEPIPFYRAYAYFQTRGAPPMAYSAANELDISALTLTLDLAYEPIPSPSGVNGVRRWKLVPRRPMASVEFVIPFENESLWDDWAGRQPKALFIQVGRVAGNTVLLSLPHLQIQNVQRVESSPSLHGIRVTATALEDNATDQTTEIRRTPVRVHRG